MSVIVPAYNVGEFLEECLDSILEQSFRGVEVLVIDDGSSDKTPRVIERYCSMYSAFRSFRLEHGGVAAARNLGLDNARGRYVCFLDGDDKFRPNALNALYDRAEECDADLVFADYVSFDGIREWEAQGAGRVFCEATYDRFDPRLLWLVAVWAKLYRRSLIDETGLRFAPLSFAEDALFYSSFVWSSRRIVTLDEKVYCYRHRPFTGQLSIVQSASLDSLHDLQSGYRLMRERAEEQLGHEPGSSCVDGQDCLAARSYIEELLRKEALTLLNLQYRRLGTSEAGAGALIGERLGQIRESVSYGVWSSLVRGFSSLCLERLPESLAEASERALVTVAVWDEGFDPAMLMQTLESLLIQRLPRIRVLLSAEATAWLQQSDVVIPEFVATCDGGSQGDFYDAALRSCRTDFLVLSQSGLIYLPDAIRRLHRAIGHTNHDVAVCMSDPPAPLGLMIPGTVLFRRSYLAATGVRFAGRAVSDVDFICRNAYLHNVGERLVRRAENWQPDSGCE